MRLSLVIQHNSIECHYAECHDYLNVMLSVIMLNVIILSVIILNVITLSVVRLNVIMLNAEAPLYCPVIWPIDIWPKKFPLDSGMTVGKPIVN